MSFLVIFVVCCLDYFAWLIALVNSCFVLILVWYSLLVIPCLNFCCSLFNNVVPLAWWCCFSCSMVLFDSVAPVAQHVVPCSILLLLLVRCCCFFFCSTLLLHVQCKCSSYSMLLFLVQRCCFFCLFIFNTIYPNTFSLRPWCCCSLFLTQRCSSLIDNVAPFFIHPRCGLLKYLSTKPMMLLFIV